MVETERRSSWVFLSNHGNVLLCIARDPQIRISEIADNVGIGNRFISFRNRRNGDSRYGNAIEPIQDSGQVYDVLMRAAARSCSAHSNQPSTTTAQMELALARRSLA